MQPSSRPTMSYHVLPCHTMSYLLPFIVQAHVMMLDGMSCAGQELQCTIWQQPRRFPGGTVCKAFACFGIYVSFPLIILQTFENISLWCPPQTSRNIQKHPETVVLCLQCQWFQADPGKAEVENATPQKKASQCVACTLFCYVLLCFVCSRYCAILCFDHDCQQLSTSTSMSSSSSVSSLSYFSVLVQTFPYFSNAVVIIKKKLWWIERCRSFF